MAELKTQKNSKSVKKFIESVEHEVRRQDSFTLLEIFKRITGLKATMWGTSIIGFGQYHYKSERSTQEGDWPMTGFSPRKSNMSVYLMTGVKQYPELLKKLGKHKHGNSCLNINKLADIDLKILEKMITTDFKAMKKKYSK
jgi:hypothetical protein